MGDCNEGQEMMIATDLRDGMKQILWTIAFNYAGKIRKLIPGQDETDSPDELLHDRNTNLKNYVVPFRLIGHENR